jgi:hypothetical protein
MGKLVGAVAASLVVGIVAGWFWRGAGSNAPGSPRPDPGAIAGEPVGATVGTRSGGAPGIDSTTTRPPAAAARPVATSVGGTVGGEAARESGDPAAATFAEQQARRIAALEADLARTKAELATARGKSGPSDLPEDGTAAERRAVAARDGNMLVEFPQWEDQLALSDEAAAKFGLTDEERAELDRMYSDFYARTLAELKGLYRELTGDPTAGESSSLNALLHDVITLSPPGACQASMIAALQALAAGLPLTPPGPDAPPCEVAIYFIFGNVDAMERAAEAMGGGAREALWSGRSTFQFSGRTDRDD